MNPKSTKVLIIGGSVIDRKSIIEHLSLSDIEVVTGPTVDESLKLENISLEVTLVAPDHFQKSYKEGYCPSCGKFLYDAKTTASNINHCCNCAPTLSATEASEYVFGKKKPKKKRMSRIEKQAMYGGK